MPPTQSKLEEDLASEVGGERVGVREHPRGMRITFLG